MAESGSSDHTTIHPWGRDRRIPIILASLFFSAALGFSIWGFYLDCLTNNKQTILNYYLPVLTALAATFLGGTILVQPSQGSPLWAYGISATGGIAIWIALMWFGPRFNDDACPKPIVINQLTRGFFQASALKGPPESRFLSEFVKKSGDDFDFIELAQVDIVPYALFAISKNALGGERRLIASVKVIAKTGQNRQITATSVIWELSDLADWRSGVLIKDNIGKFDKFAEIYAQRLPPDFALVAVVAELSCMGRGEWQGGEGEIEFQLSVFGPTNDVHLPFNAPRIFSDHAQLGCAR